MSSLFSSRDYLKKQQGRSPAKNTLHLIGFTLHFALAGELAKESGIWLPSFMVVVFSNLIRDLVARL
jgi:hypothetical protein